MLCLLLLSRLAANAGWSTLQASRAGACLRLVLLITLRLRCLLVAALRGLGSCDLSCRFAVILLLLLLLLGLQTRCADFGKRDFSPFT